jgi:hypothetical protein
MWTATKKNVGEPNSPSQIKKVVVKDVKISIKIEF